MRRTLLPLLALLLPATAAAQDLADYDYENLAFSGVGAMVSAVLPAHADPALGINIRADLGLLGPNVRIVPGLTFWSSSLKASEVARIEDRIEAACERGGVPCPGIDLGEIDVSDLALDVDAHYLWTTDFGLEPYAGVGVGVHLLNGSGDFINGTFVEDLLDAITPGASLVGGVELPLGGNLRLFGEARGVVAGNTRYLTAGLGGSWAFPAAVRRPPPATGSPRR